MLCNNHSPKYAYEKEKQIHIDEYIQTKRESKLTCKNGHELIYANGEKVKPYFRHKNNSDVGSPMTAWHSNWQSEFPVTEIDFKKKCDDQIKDRRADVLLKEHNIIVEFQHSKIDLDEVNNRKNDYELHNQKIIWIIDGNNTISVKKLDYSNRIYLEFTSENWKYKSFINYDYIFIDINNCLYKVFPKQVKSDMIDIEPEFKREDFIKYLIENNPIINQIIIPLQSNLYIKQQGAGNGKTYGLIKMLESKEFEHYKYFIVVTKQHSAINVIFNEFIKLSKDGTLKHIKNIQKTFETKKHKISYLNEKTNSNCQLIIGTIDALMYCLGNKNHNDIDLFSGIVNSIIDGYVEKNNNSIKYSGISFKLNKEVCLIGDEMQDLSIDYAKAIIQIMRNKYIDAYIVGDKLQSLKFKDNTFSYILDHDFSYINKNIYEPINICRRFYHPKLVNFVNNIIPFKNYSLTEITPYKEGVYENPLILFEGNCIRANENDESKINNEIEKIMEYYIKEVTENNYKPEDFLIVTPFTNKNPLCSALETAINMYWIEKNKDDNIKNNKYIKYAIFHKSEEGSSIDLTISEEATRIVSIHTSKGDGRNVVFVIGLTEEGLTRFSNETNNLIYDSLIHVAITRMKKTLYVRFENNGDDFSQKIEKYIHDNEDDINNDNIIRIKPNLTIFKSNKYNQLIDSLKTNENFEKLYTNFINKTDILSVLADKEENKSVIDMGHHNIRYTSMMIYLYIKIINNEIKNKDSEIKKQIQKIFNNIINEIIYKATSWQDYNICLNKEKKEKIALLKLSDTGRDYDKYFNILYSFMNNIKLKLKEIINNKIHELCPFESIVLYYMIQIHDDGIYTDITINELYNIIDIYSKSFNDELIGHDKCLCKKKFNNQIILNTNDNIKNMTNYLLVHYENINKIGKIYDLFLNKYTKVNWLINHTIYFSGMNTDFNLHKKFKLIGYDQKNVFIIYIKPQFNNLNYNHTLVDSIYDDFLLLNLKKPENNNDDEYSKSLEDYTKLANKTIRTIVFSLDNDIYHLFEWKNNEENLIIKNKMMLLDHIKNKLFNKYEIESKYLFNFYKYWIEEITKNQEQELTPDKIIKNLIAEYKKDKNIDKRPHFIIKFFERIEYKISDTRNKNEKISILNSYNDKNYFMDKLKNIILDSINDYLGIENNEE